MQAKKLTESMKIYKHSNVIKLKIGTIDISDGKITFFDPSNQVKFPNSLNRNLINGNFETFLYKFKNQPKENGIIAVEIIFINDKISEWIQADYTNDLNSDAHYTNSCGLISDINTFTDETIDSINEKIDKKCKDNQIDNQVFFSQIELKKGKKCIYIASGLGWYDITVNLNWGVNKNEKVCRLLIDFYSYLLD